MVMHASFGFIYFLFLTVMSCLIPRNHFQHDKEDSSTLSLNLNIVANVLFCFESRADDVYPGHSTDTYGSDSSVQNVHTTNPADPSHEKHSCTHSYILLYKAETCDSL